MAEVDNFLHTGDNYFDGWANGLYIRLDNEKRESGKTFIDFISPLYEFHIYLNLNIKRPISCIEKIKDLVNSSELELTDTLFFIDQILGLYKIHPINNGGLINMVLLQIQYYRNSIDNITLIQGINTNNETQSESSKTANDVAKQPTLKPTQRQLALYYYYLQKAKIYPWFASGNKTKAAEITEISKKHDVSFKKFEKYYGLVSNEDLERDIKNIKVVIQMLKKEGHNKAVEEAEKELEINSLKKK